MGLVDGKRRTADWLRNGAILMKWHEKWQAIVTTYPMPESQVGIWLEERRGSC